MLRSMLRRIRRNMRFWREYRRFEKLTRESGGVRPDRGGGALPLRSGDAFPCLDDKTSNTSFDRHYVYHTAWGARVLAELRPEKHVDISSTLYFSGMVSAFMPVEFYDYRPAALILSDLTAKSADLTKLPFPSRSIQSLSCMHVLEHIGLGRYGDPLDPEGDLKGMRELQRVLAPGGNLLVAMPVGEPRICFNAHRIYSYEMILEGFSELELVEFALIPGEEEKGGLIRHADPNLVRGERYACGCFRFSRAGRQ